MTGCCPGTPAPLPAAGGREVPTSERTRMLRGGRGSRTEKVSGQTRFCSRSHPQPHTQRALSEDRPLFPAGRPLQRGASLTADVWQAVDRRGAGQPSQGPLSLPGVCPASGAGAPAAEVAVTAREAPCSCRTPAVPVRTAAPGTPGRLRGSACAFGSSSRMSPTLGPCSAGVCCSLSSSLSVSQVNSRGRGRRPTAPRGPKAAATLRVPTEPSHLVGRDAARELEGAARR